ncbi:CHY zinc finger protein [Microlunatus sp. Gsoil 973]|uniref:CHY zinc finger protein n=1 Tax=Microlunatus sp. Gsoil 973 TaxID=2672569 RepID=UPI0012B44C87|nr:CHY zinc finger protein [Microlunatus sp. Gsoil 973]QGN31569.1 hypothetical protein GJV80_00575 [Microlunatus sp. Gsoil 973]
MERPVVRGAVVDDETRCAHYHGPSDIIAIKFRCCGEFYPCFRCHQDAADHPIERWPIADQEQPAVLCGACGHVLTVRGYLDSSGCPSCSAQFNERCALHHHLYFEPASV